MADMGVQMEKTRLLQKHGNLALQSFTDNPAVQTLYLSAAMLFVLILIAGVLMISSSINSNVAQRAKFFGMMRCIGMSRQQIIRFVRLEALNWCKTAVPIGVALGIIITWVLCVLLRFWVGGEFSEITLFGVSPMGIISGVVVGVITVLIAASSPAKRAAKVSPVTALTGNGENSNAVTPMANPRFFKVETMLGIGHSLSAKKNLVLMTSSFALSIILFLCFSVFIEFIGYLMPQSSNASDLNLSSVDGSNSVDRGLLEELEGMAGVKRVFGRRSSFDIPAEIRQPPCTIDMISYGEFDLNCLTTDGLMKKGSDIAKVYGDSQYALAVWDKESGLETGDYIMINNEQLQIAGLLRYNPFSSDGSTDGKITLIVSGEAFTRLSGITDYSLVLIQTTKDATEEDVAAIHNAVNEKGVFQDRRDQRTSSTYTAFLLFVYGFLAIIALVAVLNIMNSISMSVSARIKQYGAMRAVGMDGGQLTKMIAAEAATYALFGCAVGCSVGLLLSKLFYDTFITAHFSYAIWSFPVIPLSVILLFVLVATAAAVYAPAKRIRSISVIETLNEL